MSITATAIVQTVALVAFALFCLTYVWPGFFRTLDNRKAYIARELAKARSDAEKQTQSDINDRS